eukprot:SM000094S24697  [mRNA]  locus=s94:231425:234767:- [translate_table: standard]
MHVFDRRPLEDELPIVRPISLSALLTLHVICNACCKPLKESQYVAHAARCKGPAFEREDAQVPVGGAAEGAATAAATASAPPAACTSSRKPPRKGRRKFPLLQDVSQLAGAKVGRPRKYAAVADAGRGPVHEDRGWPSPGSAADAALLSPRKRIKMARNPPSAQELNFLCGVLLHNGAHCRRPLTCKYHSDAIKRTVPGRHRPYDALLEAFIAGGSRLPEGIVYRGVGDSASRHKVFVTDHYAPLPLAVKLECVRHSHRMRGVLSTMFREACVRAMAAASGAQLATAVLPPPPVPAGPAQAVRLPPAPPPPPPPPPRPAQQPTPLALGSPNKESKKVAKPREKKNGAGLGGRIKAAQAQAGLLQQPRLPPPPPPLPPPSPSPLQSSQQGLHPQQAHPPPLPPAQPVPGAAAAPVGLLQQQQQQLPKVVLKPKKHQQLPKPHKKAPPPLAGPPLPALLLPQQHQQHQPQLPPQQQASPQPPLAMWASSLGPSSPVGAVPKTLGPPKSSQLRPPLGTSQPGSGVRILPLAPQQPQLPPPGGAAMLAGFGGLP